ncbi:hypothetical protein ACHQM5_012358 [Ranunculus cassubicifolius]
MWDSDPACREIIKSQMNCEIVGSSSYRLLQKLKNLKHKLIEWNRNHFGNIYARQAEVKQKLSRLEEKNCNARVSSATRHGRGSCPIARD